MIVNQECKTLNDVLSFIKNISEVEVYNERNIFLGYRKNFEDLYLKVNTPVNSYIVSYSVPIIKNLTIQEAINEVLKDVNYIHNYKIRRSSFSDGYSLVLKNNFTHENHDIFIARGQKLSHYYTSEKYEFSAEDIIAKDWEII